MASSPAREESFLVSSGLTALPSEVLTLILEYLPLLDLCNARLVCSRLKELVDDSGSLHLWANASLEGLWISGHQAIIQKAANSGNIEALIKLAVAYLYGEGVPEDPGKGTEAAVNGQKATEFLARAEQLTQHTPPFSWVFIRPPWASSINLCCKACVCYKMKETASAEGKTGGLHYCIGKALSFHEDDHEKRREAVEWFERGASHHCHYSSLEVWRMKHKGTLPTNEFQSVRLLRQAVNKNDSLEAQFELCLVYAEGYYGGRSRQQVCQTIREVMGSAGSALWSHAFHLQESWAITRTMRYILIDWVVEVAEMKQLPPPTVHLAVGLVNRFLLRRNVARSKLQLLGITALLVATKWTNMAIITIREAAWLTDSTYKYEEVVRMMGELVGAFKGNLKKPTICDYLEILMKLVRADTATRCMAYFLSESTLLHTEFGRFSAAHVAAACLLNARILLRQEYPWPSHMPEATGFTVSGLQKCCIMIYDRCLSKKYSITDHRSVELRAISERYADERFLSISSQEFMAYKEFKERLGLEPNSPCPLLTPAKPSGRQKLLSFLSDSCYLSSLSQQSPSDEESDQRSPLEESLLEQFSTHKLSSSSSSPNYDELDQDILLIPSGHRIENFSPHSGGLKMGNCGFPQPLFSEASSPMSSPIRPSPAWLPHNPLEEEGMEISNLEPPVAGEHSTSPSSSPLPDLDFNLAPLNEIPNLEPTPANGVLTNTPRKSLNTISPMMANFGWEGFDPALKENAPPLKSVHPKKVSNFQLHNGDNSREALQPLEQNCGFAPLVSLKHADRKGKQPVTGRTMRKKKTKSTSRDCNV